MIEIEGHINSRGIIIPHEWYIDRFNKWLAGNFDSKIFISITKQKKKRSNNQNNYYWGCIVAPLADYFGYTADEMHIALKFMFLKIENPGKPSTVRSTADSSFTTADAEKYYEEIRRWALQEYNFIIQLPNEVL